MSQQNFVCRDDAKQAGLPRYFTGLPCVHGHISERYVRNYACVECHMKSVKDNIKRNPDRKRQKDARYRAKHYESLREKQTIALRLFRKLNPEKSYQHTLKYLAKNPGLRNAWAAKRRSDKSQRTPIWFSDFDELVWAEAAHLVQMRQAATGIKWHADHVEPLRGKKVSGLHVGLNCQVIPKKLNQQKSNRQVLTRPGEWVLSGGLLT